MPTEQEKRLQRCCFTGQRPEKLTEVPEAVQQWLKKQIENAIIPPWQIILSFLLSRMKGQRPRSVGAVKLNWLMNTGQ